MQDQFRGEGAFIYQHRSHTISHDETCVSCSSVEVVGEQSIVLYPIIQRRQIVHSIKPGRRYDTVAFAVSCGLDSKSNAITGARKNPAPAHHKALARYKKIRSYRIFHRKTPQPAIFWYLFAIAEWNDELSW